MSTSKFNLKYYAFHGHEKTHDNFLISMLVDKEKGWGSDKIVVVFKKKRCS